MILKKHTRSFGQTLFRPFRLCRAGFAKACVAMAGLGAALVCAPCQASGLRERDSAYAAAGNDCRKALSLCPKDTAVEVAPSRFICGGSFTYFDQKAIDEIQVDDSGKGVESALRSRSRKRQSLIAFGYSRAGLIEIRGDSVTVWREFSFRDTSQAHPIAGRLHPTEIQVLDSLIALAPSGIFRSQYLVDIQADPLEISIRGKKLILIDPGVLIWGAPLKDIGNLRDFLQTVSNRIAGKPQARQAISQEELKALDVP